MGDDDGGHEEGHDAAEARHLPYQVGKVCHQADVRHLLPCDIPRV